MVPRPNRCCYATRGTDAGRGVDAEVPLAKDGKAAPGTRADDVMALCGATYCIVAGAFNTFHTPCHDDDVDDSADSLLAAASFPTSAALNQHFFFDVFFSTTSFSAFVIDRYLLLPWTFSCLSIDPSKVFYLTALCPSRVSSFCSLCLDAYESTQTTPVSRLC